MLYKLHQDNIFYDRYPKKNKENEKINPFLCFGIYLVVGSFFFCLGRYNRYIEIKSFDYYTFDGQ